MYLNHFSISQRSYNASDNRLPWIDVGTLPFTAAASTDDMPECILWNASTGNTVGTLRIGYYTIRLTIEPIAGDINDCTLYGTAIGAVKY